jgi:hypothetical protein
MAIAVGWECAGVIHDVLAGLDEELEGGARDASARATRHPLMPVWDPVQGRAVFPAVAPVGDSAEVARREAELEERLRRKPSKKVRAKARNRSRELPEGEAFDLVEFERELERRKLSLGEFRGVVRAGGFKAVHLVAQGPYFVIQGEPQGRLTRTALGTGEGGWLMLVTTKGRTNHRFLNPTRALAMLKALGVTNVQVDMESWRPDAPTDVDRVRPDMAERLRFAHEAARGRREGASGLGDGE